MVQCHKRQLTGTNCTYLYFDDSRVNEMFELHMLSHWQCVSTRATSEKLTIPVIMVFEEIEKEGDADAQEKVTIKLAWLPS